MVGYFWVVFIVREDLAVGHNGVYSAKDEAYAKAACTCCIIGCRAVVREMQVRNASVSYEYALSIVEANLQFAYESSYEPSSAANYLQYLPTFDSRGRRTKEKSVNDPNSFYM